LEKRRLGRVEKRTDRERIEVGQRGRAVVLGGGKNFGRRTEGKRGEKNSVAGSFCYVLIFRCV
jgi:hypothetical protein